MNITFDKNGQKTLIALSGDVTIYSVAALKDQLLSHITEASSLEIDLSEVCDFDSAGLQVLLLAKRESIKRQCNLILKAHSAPVLQIFELYDLAPFFGDPLLILTDTEQSSARSST